MQGKRVRGGVLLLTDIDAWHATWIGGVSVYRFDPIGDGVVMWTLNHVGHRGVIGSHSFVTSGVVVAGFSRVGESCFLGVNCTLANNVTVGRDCVIGAGAVVVRNTEPGKVYKGERAAEPGKVGSLALFKVKEAA